MLNITEAAAEQIKLSITEETKGMPLRVAAAKMDDGSIQYGMGFDENKSDTDAVIDCEGVEVLIADNCLELLTGATIDFVELEEDNKHFIFINPNDPNHKAPDNN